jgi:hypothetical protein
LVNVRLLSSLLWLLIGVALGLAVVSFLRARRVSRRLDELSAAYWELRYEHGQLRARVARLEPQEPGDDDAPTGSTAFIPLSSLKR